MKKPKKRYPCILRRKTDLQKFSIRHLAKQRMIVTDKKQGVPVACCKSLQQLMDLLLVSFRAGMKRQWTNLHPEDLIG